MEHDPNTPSSNAPSHDEDRRQHPRFAVELQSEVEIDGERLPATTRDVSRGGICLVTTRGATLGTVLPLHLSLSLGSSSFSEAVALPARVVWCTSLDASTFQLGATFHQLTHHQIGELEMCLRFLQRESQMEPLTRAGDGAFDLSERQEQREDSDDA